MEAIGTGYDRPGHDHPSGCMCNICIQWRRSSSDEALRKEMNRRAAMSFAKRILSIGADQAAKEWFDIQREAHEIVKRDGHA